MDVNGVSYVSEVIGNGGGLGLFGWFFFVWHSVQPFTYSVTSFFMAGHQKSRAIAQIVFEIPGCLLRYGLTDQFLFILLGVLILES